MTAHRARRQARRLPRVPLPRQKGGAHADRTGLPARKQKHKKRPGAEDT